MMEVSERYTTEGRFRIMSGPGAYSDSYFSLSCSWTIARQATPMDSSVMAVSTDTSPKILKTSVLTPIANATALKISLIFFI